MKQTSLGLKKIVRARQPASPRLDVLLRHEIDSADRGARTVPTEKRGELASLTGRSR